ncbi:zinc-binding dehydrogenase [Paenibacillus sp. MMS20-IR301]|uniref:zinc-binding dehydrogenase n=1 Tax=Paenibacillus sp. MMS20-IR301 TaxID=2895946 RepID=UPI0028F07408|nr:zinc-binding dehydrogenase [Paenibacillus sp. MMS20-IR301]WNS46871.1 zinc-binding dehydrogenase [Paenibacillus sp. MMS20-IR301]
MIRTIVVDPHEKSLFRFKEVDAPQAKPWEALVQVKAVSLNRGEVSDAKNQEMSSRPGWDFAGIVLEPAENGAGPQKGAQVVGLLSMGAWSEQVAAPVSLLAEIPDKLTFTEAATLPVAGLTALYALRKGGMLLGKRIFITGSSGGVGLFAHQLAAQSGAFVVGTASTEEKAGLVRENGSDEVIIGYSAISSARKFGPYDLIIDSVGGNTLATLLPLLAPRGVCVAVGFSSSNTAMIDMMNLVTSGGRTLYSFFLGEELSRQSATDDLSLLVRLVTDGLLIPRIGVEASWTEINTVAHNLMERKFSGKAVLLID